MSEAPRVDISTDQGADFALEIYWTDYNNNPYKVLAPMRMQVRDSTGNLVTEFLPNTESGELSDIGISYNPDRGMIILSKDALKMSQVPAGNYQYDLFVTYEDRAYIQATGQDVTTPRTKRLIFGSFTVTGRITTNV